MAEIAELLKGGNTKFSAHTAFSSVRVSAILGGLLCLLAAFALDQFGGRSERMT